MYIQEFDKVKLKSGETAYIVEVLEQGKMYVGDIDRSNSDTETEFINQEQILKVLK